MADPHVVTALIKNRAEIAGLIEHHQTMLRQAIIDLDNLDVALRLFVPDIDLEEIRPRPVPPRHAAFKGEVSRIVLAALREAKEPMTTQQLARHVMAERGLNTADKRLLRTIGKRVGAFMRHWRGCKTVRSFKGSGSLLRCKIAD
jgi:hypothetical protein